MTQTIDWLDAPPPGDDDDPAVDQPLLEPPVHADPNEAALLGAMLLSPKAIDAALATGLERQAFTTRGHPEIFAAIDQLHTEGKQADVVTVAHRLGTGANIFGGKPYLVELQAHVPAIGNAPTYAQNVHDAWTARAARWALSSAVEDIDNGQPPRNVVAKLSERLPTDHSVGNNVRAVDGATFLLDTSADVESVWGQGDQSLWAEGEGLMIVGPTGIGKTTLIQQVVLGRIGVRTEVLGMPVTPGRNRVLYLAMDRPKQAARSMKRMVEEADRDLLEELLVFWKGPLPFSIIDDPLALARFAKNHGADTVIIDSMKDICHKLTGDEESSKTNSAIQECLACGIEVGVNHHQRKAIAGTKKDAPPKTIDDIYGNQLLTAGMGSILLVWGQAGDPLVELTQLKMPVDQIGPWTIRMDFDLGYSTIEEQGDPLKIVNLAPRGTSVNLVARLLYKTEEPTKNEIEKARRQLNKLVEKGLIAAREGDHDGAGKAPVMYFPIDLRRVM